MNAESTRQKPIAKNSTASMRPHSDECGKTSETAFLESADMASMRPHSEECGKMAIANQKPRPLNSFNEAAFG